MQQAWMVALVLGFVLGLKHALDPDHMVAVSTIVSQHKSVARSSLVGTFWGLGHTASLLAVGLIVIVSQRAVPPRVAEWMELAVAFMLVWLGIVTLRKTFKAWHLHRHVHTHDGHTHSHLHLHNHKEDETKAGRHHHAPLRVGLRPFLVGTVHGMAGSGALMLLVLGTIPTSGRQLAYIATFGVGSIGGMLIMSTLISLPFVFTAIKFEQMNRYIQAGAGVLSAVFGCFLIWQNGIATGLLIPGA